jgi:hypothetical protein
MRNSLLLFLEKRYKHSEIQKFKNLKDSKDLRIQRFKGYYRHGVPVDYFAVDRTFGTEVKGMALFLSL